MSEQITIARPYAEAAFSFAKDQSKVNEWQMMLTFAAEVSQQSAIKSLMNSDIRAEAIATIFIDICEDQLDEYQKNFIRVVAENHRLSFLPEVLELYANYRQELDSTIEADLISASQLSSAQLEKISKAIEKKLNRKINLNTSIDSSLLSGFIVRAGDFVIDNSIKAQLTRLSLAVQS